MASLIAISADQAASADFTLAAGASTTLSLTNANTNASGVTLPTPIVALIQLKGSSNAYVTVGQIDSGTPQKVLSAIGTFRVLKLASAVAAGVDRD